MKRKLRGWLSVIISFVLKLLITIIPRKKEQGMNILILSYFNLGDLLCDIPSIRAIHTEWPEAKIHVLVRRQAGCEMLEKCPYVDSVEKMVSDLDSWNEYIKKLIHLRKMNFSVSFQFVRPFDQYRKTNIPYIIGVPNRYGIIEKRDEKVFRHCFSKYIYTYGRTSRKEESIKVTSLAGIENIFHDTECWIPDEIDDNYKKNNEKYVVIHPGATLQIKCWPKEKYINIIEYVAEKYTVYVTGVMEESELLEEIKSKVPKSVKFILNASLYEFWALLKYSSLVITNDTGTLHFAIALKRNVISIFGPTFPDYAIGRDLPENCVVIRGTTHKCNFEDCKIFREIIGKRKQEIVALCLNKNRVCTDIVSCEIVKYFIDIFFEEHTEVLKLIHNFQGYAPFGI